MDRNRLADEPDGTVEPVGAPADSTVPAGSSAGLFLSIYNGGTSSDTLESVSAPGWASSVTLSGGPVALPANAAPVNLTGPQPEVVLENLSQSLRGGSTLPVTLQFAHAGAVTMQVPIEPQSFQWATFSPPAVVPTTGVPHRIASRKTSPNDS